MGDVRQWISVKIQRALGFESVNDVADIVSSIMAKSDAKDIESNLRVRSPCYFRCNCPPSHPSMLTEGWFSTLLHLLLDFQDFLGSDDTAEEIISGYFKKIGIPRAVAVRVTNTHFHSI